MYPFGCQSTFLKLPNELLSAIAECVSERHTIFDYVVECASLASLTTTCRRMRAVCAPHLFRDVPITSEQSLHALSRCPTDLLRHVRTLNLFMDDEFLEAWKSSASPTAGATGSPPVVIALVAILHRTPYLRVLRIRMAETTGRRSAWRKFRLSRAEGIPFGKSFELATQSFPTSFILPRLKIMEIDGFQDINPLLVLAPELEVLHVSLSAGYPIYANADLIAGLGSVPKLRELAFSPDSLRLIHGSDENDDVITSANGYMNEHVDSAGFVQALGERLPYLEHLDLRTRWYGYGIYYCSSSEPISAQDLVTALTRMPNLKRLCLPSSIMTNTQFDTLRTPIPISTPETAREDLPTLRAVIDSRRQALQDVTTAEWNIVEQISTQTVGLEYVSFVRNYFPDDPVEYEVRYGTLRLDQGDSMGQSPTIVSVKLIEARDDQEAPWPFAPNLSLSHTLRRLWSSTTTLSSKQAREHKHRRSVRGSNVNGTSRSTLQSYAEGSLVSSLLVGSALFAYYSTLVRRS